MNPGHELGRLRCYPYITDARAFEYRSAINRFGVFIGLEKRVRAATVMLIRRRLGVVVMILFPSNQTEAGSEPVEGLGPIYVDIHHQSGYLVLVPSV